VHDATVGVVQSFKQVRHGTNSGYQPSHVNKDFTHVHQACRKLTLPPDTKYAPNLGAFTSCDPYRTCGQHTHVAGL
jgi:hypothetical protein